MQVRAEAETANSGRARERDGSAVERENCRVFLGKLSVQEEAKKRPGTAPSLCKQQAAPQRRRLDRLARQQAATDCSMLGQPALPARAVPRALLCGAAGRLLDKGVAQRVLGRDALVRVQLHHALQQVDQLGGVGWRVGVGVGGTTRKWMGCWWVVRVGRGGVVGGWGVTKGAAQRSASRPGCGKAAAEQGLLSGHVPAPGRRWHAAWPLPPSPAPPCTAPTCASLRRSGDCPASSAEKSFLMVGFEMRRRTWGRGGTCGRPV